MKLGVYTAVLDDRSVADALDVIARGFLPPAHLPIDGIQSSDAHRDEYPALFSGRGITTAYAALDPVESTNT